MSTEDKRELLKKLLAQKTARAPEKPAPQARPERPPLSSGQERIYSLSRMSRCPADYHISGLIRLRGPLDVTALEDAFSAVVARHEILRTVFPAIERQPFQQVLPAEQVSFEQVDLSEDPQREQTLEERCRLAVETAFAIEASPPRRLLLFRLSAEEHALLFVLHNLIADGRSLEILFREVAAGYAAKRSGTTATLPTLPLQYADYATRERANLAQTRAQLSHWREVLRSPPKAIPLPFDRPGQPATFHRGSARFELEKGTADALRALARANRATLFMVLEAAYHAFLHGVSAQEDLAVGLAVDARFRPDTRELIGCFQNTIVLRMGVAGDPSFNELVGRSREMCLGAFGHQEVPFQDVVREVKPPREPGRMPLFQVMFGLETIANFEALAGVETRWRELDYGTTPFELIIRMFERADGSLYGFVTFREDLFSEEKVNALLSGFSALLKRASDRPEQRLSELVSVLR